MRTLLAALLLASPALAQDGNVCRENQFSERPVNPATSELWNAQVAARDATLMSQVAGQWAFAPIPSPDGTMVNQQVQLLDPTGSWAYQDQTCPTQMQGMPCSQNQGVGRWVALPEAGGTILIAINFSDLQRQDECTSMRVSLGPNGTLLDANTGQPIAQRVN